MFYTTIKASFTEQFFYGYFTKYVLKASILEIYCKIFINYIQ